MSIDELINKCPYCGGNKVVQKLVGDESFDFCKDCKRVIEGMEVEDDGY